MAHGLLNHLAPVQLMVGRDSATGMKMWRELLLAMTLSKVLREL